MSGITSPLKKSVAAHGFCSFSKLQIYSSLPKITVLIFSIDWFQEFFLFKKKSIKNISDSCSLEVYKRPTFSPLGPWKPKPM